MIDAPGAGPDPLPPVERLRPGLTSVPVPLPNNSLRYVFVYVFESDQGVYLVDAGWNTDDAYAALEAGLRFAGYEMGDVRGVMVTHIHPDHYGLAGRIRAASGAWISLHPADARLIQDRYIEPTDLLERMGQMLRRMGAPEAEIATLQSVA
ncbi:MAG: MBL fold metallo-hydrolase, partial [Acidimicrobiia bacterium]